VNTANNALCDDGNAATSDTCVPGDPAADANGCVFAAAGFCSGPNQTVVCEFSGAQTWPIAGQPAGAPAAGTYAICSLRIAAADPTCATNSGNACRASAMQYKVRFDTTQMHIVNMFDVLTIGLNSFNVKVTGMDNVAGAQPLSTGHSVSITPSLANPINAGYTLATWNPNVNGPAGQQAGGFGAAVVVNLSNPAAALSNANVVANVVSGNPEVLRIFFRAPTGATTPTAAQNAAWLAALAANPAKVCIEDPLLTNGISQKLTTVWNNTTKTFTTTQVDPNQ
jgi:hypothetical protein